MNESDATTVLVVDDDPEVLDLYRSHLEGDYEVLTAATGEEALETLGESCQVVILDRRLPDISGGEVLERIRERETGCRVAMVTAVDPDFDIIEMPFDDYLVKPVSGDQLHETIEHLLARIRYSDLLEEYYRTANKVAALQAAKPRHELDENEEFAELKAEVRRLHEQVTETLMELDDYVMAFREIERVPALYDVDD